MKKRLSETFFLTYSAQLYYESSSIALKFLLWSLLKRQVGCLCSCATCIPQSISSPKAKTNLGFLQPHWGRRTLTTDLAVWDHCVERTVIEKKEKMLISQWENAWLSTFPQHYSLAGILWLALYALHGSHFVVAPIPCYDNSKYAQ